MFQEDSLVLYYIVGTLFIGLLVGFILFFIYVYHLKVKQMISERNSQELKKQQEIYFALQTGEEKERKRLAEELHDGIGAKLSGLKMNLEFLQTKFNNPEYDTMFVKLASEMDDSINEIRELSQNLKPAFIYTQNLKQALLILVDKLNISSSIKSHIEVNILHDPPFEMKLSIYRIVTELHINIYKHSKATNAFIQVIEHKGNIQIIVEDNGIGFNANQHNNGNGMFNIKSRVASLNGNFSIDSSAKGTTIIIDIPVQKV